MDRLTQLVYVIEGAVLMSLGNAVLYDINIIYSDIVWFLVIVAGFIQVFIGGIYCLKGGTE